MRRRKQKFEFDLLKENPSYVVLIIGAILLSIALLMFLSKKFETSVFNPDIRAKDRIFARIDERSQKPLSDDEKLQIYRWFSDPSHNDVILSYEERVKLFQAVHKGL
jgi:hypothetical protein